MGYKIQKIYVGDKLVRPKAPNPMDLLTGVVYYFPMQGDMNNYSGKEGGNLTTYSGSATIGNNYTTISSARLINNDFTYSGTNQTLGIWINLTTSSEFISAGYDGNGALGWGIGLQHNAGRVVISNSSLIVASFTSIVGGWHFLVLTYNGSVATMYVDGVSVGSLSISGSVRSTKGICIGSFGTYTGNTSGQVGITFLTESAVTADQVSAFYNATKSLYGIS